MDDALDERQRLAAKGQLGPARRADQGGGVVLGAAIGLALAWLVAAAAVFQPADRAAGLRDQVQRSSILRTALDRAYGVAEPRAFWLRRLQGLGFVFGGAGGIFVVILLIVVGPIAWEAALTVVPFIADMQGTFNIVRYGIGSLSLLTVIWCL